MTGMEKVVWAGSLDWIKKGKKNADAGCGIEEAAYGVKPRLYKRRELPKRFDIHRCSHMQPSEVREKGKANNQSGSRKSATE